MAYQLAKRLKLGQIVEGLIYLTVLSMPLYVLRFKIVFVPFTFLEALILLTLATFLGEKILALGSLSKERIKSDLEAFKRLSEPLNLLSVLFVLTAFLSILYSPDQIGGLGIFKAYFLEPVLFFFVIQDKIKKKEQFYRLLISLFASGLGISLLVIFQHFSSVNPFAPYEILQGRASGVYDSANAVGLFLGPISALLLPILFLGVGKKDRFSPGSILGLGAILITNLLAIYFSFSQGAMASLPLTALCLGFFSLPFLFKKISFKLLFKIFSLGMILGLSLSLAFFIFISQFTPKLEEPPSTRVFNDTLTIRLCTWEGTKKLLEKSPILGAGLDGFHDRYQENLTCDSELFQYPHNLFLNFWTETGIIGLGLFLIIVFLYFKKNFGNLGSIRDRSEYSGFSAKILIGLNLGMIYWLFHGLVDVPYFKNDLSLLFWVLVAMTKAWRADEETTRQVEK